MGDLFPDSKPGTYKSLAYRTAPGSGPAKEKCKTCRFMYRQAGNSKTYSKCELMSGTHSRNTDISMYSPACRFWEKENINEG